MVHYLVRTWPEHLLRLGVSRLFRLENVVMRVFVSTHSVALLKPQAYSQTTTFYFLGNPLLSGRIILASRTLVQSRSSITLDKPQIH